MLMRMKDNPKPQTQGQGCMLLPAHTRKIMHASLHIAGTTVMCSDDTMQDQPAFRRFALAISADDEAAARKDCDALTEGGQPSIPLGRTFCSPCFGMVNNRFGVCWMVGTDH